MNQIRDWWETAAEHLELARDLRYLRIRFDPEKCTGAFQCVEVCPIGCWVPDRTARMVAHVQTERCIACGACVLQCPEGAIALKVPAGRAQG